jgi:hypothetical protein
VFHNDVCCSRVGPTSFQLAPPSSDRASVFSLLAGENKIAPLPVTASVVSEASYPVAIPQATGIGALATRPAPGAA